MVGKSSATLLRNCFKHKQVEEWVGGDAHGLILGLDHGEHSGRVLTIVNISMTAELENY